MRRAMQTPDLWMRLGLGATAALVLVVYAIVVNSPPWNFSDVLGAYIVAFFVVSQAVAWWFDGRAPSLAVWIGGALIVTGGLVIVLFAPRLR